MNRSQLISQIQNFQSYLCVGLDTDITKLPTHLRNSPDAIVTFNKSIIDATKDHCVSYKINTAFYESQGWKGWETMEQTVNHIPSTHFKIADAKRGDIGNTASQYAKTFFETLHFDAVTVSPYMGEDSLRPFLEYTEKWTIVLGLTSNKGSNDFQRLMVEVPYYDILQGSPKHQPLYEKVLQTTSTWGTPENMMYVVGATHAADIKHIRSILPQHFFLVPGIGTQGGSLAEVSLAGINKHIGILINISRAILYASQGEDFAAAAQNVAATYHNEMKTYLNSQTQ